MAEFRPQLGKADMIFTTEEENPGQPDSALQQPGNETEHELKPIQIPRNEKGVSGEAIRIPPYLFALGLVTQNPDGTITLNKLNRDVYKVFKGIVDAKTNGRVDSYAALHNDTLLSILKNGDKKDGITAEMATAFASGQLVLDAEGKPDPNKNSRLSAAWKAVERKMQVSHMSGELILGLLTIFGTEKVEKIATEWISKDKHKYPRGSKAEESFQKFHQVWEKHKYGSATQDQLREAMTSYYNSLPSNTRGDLNGAIIRFIPPPVYT